MIALSSARPMSECAEYRRNQLAAKASWEQVFDKIVYFNRHESELAAPKTRFIEGSMSPPRIWDMVETANQIHGWSCIINADIVVDPKFKLVEDKLNEVGAACAFSLRFPFTPETGQRSRGTMDLGLDVFCAVKEAWSNLLTRIPKAFRLGHAQWDTFVLQYFARNYPGRCYDFTPSHCIFHPIHGNRKDQSIPAIDDPYLKDFIWPDGVISV